MTDFENQYGKVQLDLPRGPQYSAYDVHGRQIQARDTGADAQIEPLHGPSTCSSPSLLRSFAEWYVQQPHVQAVPTAEHFKQEARGAGHKQEEFLWALMEDVFTDAESADRYHPDVIGVETTQPHRRWYISHYAYIQWLLQHNETLRRANIICRWLEKSYRDDSRQEPKLRGEDDVALLQLVLSYIRGGELHRAISDAVTYESCAYSCLLSAAQLQTTQEAWFTETALVPLFGEYGNGELNQAWCGNEHRLDNLSQLYEESAKYGQGSAAVQLEGTSSGAASPAPASAESRRSDFDAVIGAALCGNVEVLESAFSVNGSWRDLVWCYLRSTLVIAFTKQLMVSQGSAGAVGEAAGHAAATVLSQRYAAYVESKTGRGDQWVDHLSKQMVEGLTHRLQRLLPDLPLAEALQVRFILQVLTTALDGSGNGTASAFTALRREWFDIEPQEGDCDAARLISHAVLLQDIAYSETLCRHSVQMYGAASFATSLSRYATCIALLPRFSFDEGLAAIIAMARHIVNPKYRAQVYARFILAAREYELERKDLTRGQLEEQEARLVRQFVQEDENTAMHQEVQLLLRSEVVEQDLLTHHKLSEELMWQTMHARTISDYLEVLRRGLVACCSFWNAAAKPELEAIADVSSILTRRVLPEIAHLVGGAGAAGEGNQTSASCAVSPVSSGEQSEATFWYLFSEAWGIAQEHTKRTAELRAARGAVALLPGNGAGPHGNGNRTAVYQLAQEETDLLQRLAEHTQQAVRQGGAVVARDRQCCTAVVWLVQQFTEEVTLSLMGSGEMTDDGPVPQNELSLIQSVFGLIAELDEAGYFEEGLVPKESAASLYTQVRTMRVSYGQLAHRRHVVAALKQRAAIAHVDQ